MKINTQQKDETDQKPEPDPPSYQEPPTAPPTPSTSHHINQFSALFIDSDDSDDDDFLLERISKSNTINSHMIRRSSSLNDDDTDTHTDISIGQIKFNARMAAREGRP